MDEEMQANTETPMEEDDTDIGKEDKTTEDSKSEDEKTKMTDSTVTKLRENEEENCVMLGAKAQETDLGSYYFVPNEFGKVLLNQPEAESILDEEDVEIQRLTQSLLQLGTGRIQRSLLTDEHEENPGPSNSDADS